MIKNKTIHIVDDFPVILALRNTIIDHLRSILDAPVGQKIEEVGTIVRNHPSLAGENLTGYRAFTRLILSHDRNSFRAAVGSEVEKWKPYDHQEEGYVLRGLSVDYSNDAMRTTFHNVIDFTDIGEAEEHSNQLQYEIENQVEEAIKVCCTQGKTTADIFVPMFLWESFKVSAESLLTYYNQFYALSFNGGQTQIRFYSPQGIKKNDDWYYIGLAITPVTE